jgi:hypothetical protein
MNGWNNLEARNPGKEGIDNFQSPGFLVSKLILFAKKKLDNFLPDRLEESSLLTSLTPVDKNP